VFAAGDVRQGSTKQLGSAVGEGISAILRIRGYLREATKKVRVAAGA
jgi:thioredoxin reductase (NADPH)